MNFSGPNRTAKTRTTRTAIRRNSAISTSLTQQIPLYRYSGKSQELIASPVTIFCETECRLIHSDGVIVCPGNQFRPVFTKSFCDTVQNLFAILYIITQFVSPFLRYQCIRMESICQALNCNRM